MTATKRIVLCGSKGEELFSGYSIAIVPSTSPHERTASGSASGRGRREESGVYLRRRSVGK